jgi:hypothetical protein
LVETFSVFRTCFPNLAQPCTTTLIDVLQSSPHNAADDFFFAAPFREQAEPAFTRHLKNLCGKNSPRKASCAAEGVVLP